MAKVSGTGLGLGGEGGNEACFRLFAGLRNGKEVPLKEGAKKNWLGRAEEEGGVCVRINRGRKATCCLAVCSSQLIQCGQ